MKTIYDRVTRLLEEKSIFDEENPEELMGTRDVPPEKPEEDPVEEEPESEEEQVEENPADKKTPPNPEDNKTIFIVKYRKLFTSPSGHLAVVTRIGWDSRAGGNGGGRYYIMHMPTQSDLGLVFGSEADARNFTNYVDNRWDWGFSNFEESDINVDEVYRTAGRLFGLNILGNKL